MGRSCGPFCGPRSSRRAFRFSTLIAAAVSRATRRKASATGDSGSLISYSRVRGMYGPVGRPSPTRVGKRPGVGLERNRAASLDRLRCGRLRRRLSGGLLRGVGRLAGAEVAKQEFLVLAHLAEAFDVAPQAVAAGSVEEQAHLINEVSAGSAEQAQGFEKVAASVLDIEKVTQSNAANAEQTAAASQELATLADGLDEMSKSLLTLVRKASETKDRT